MTVKVYENSAALTEYVSRRPHVMNEPGWFHGIRQKALEKFKSSQWPTQKDEEWRRTSLKDFDLDALEFVEAVIPEKIRRIEDTELEQAEHAGKLSFHNGQATSQGLLTDLAQQGVYFNDLSGFFSDAAQVGRLPEALVAGVEKAYAEALGNADNKVFQWGLAGLGYGAVLYLPKSVEVEDIFRITMSQEAEDVASFPSLFIILEDQAKAAVHLTWSGEGGFLINQSNAFLVGEAAELSVAQVQRSSDEVVVFSNTRTIVQRDARFRHFEALLGAGFVKNRVDSTLAGPGSDLELDGIYYADEERHMDLRTVQHHIAPNTVSNAVYRGAVNSGAQTVYQGLIEVALQAKKTDAYLSNKNLVLSDGSHADSIPCLQIDTNDVRCSHGSTTGKLDPEQIFYLESRGFPKEDAIQALILAYYEDVLGRAQEQVAQEVRTLLEEQLVDSAHEIALSYQL
jgi:Fe-S cluster assembly protein SufD